MIDLPKSYFESNYLPLYSELQFLQLGINIEENSNFDDQKQSTSNEQTSDTDNETIEVNDNDKVEDDSIESIPFIAEPSKEKRTRSTKQLFV